MLLPTVQAQEQIERPSLFQNNALFPVREKDGLITIIDTQQTTTCVSGDAVLQESVHVSQVMLEPPVEEFITEFSPDDDPEASVSEMLRAFQHLSRRVDGCLQVSPYTQTVTPQRKHPAFSAQSHMLIQSVKLLFQLLNIP